MGDGQNEGVPVEEVAFSFDEIKITHTQYDENGQPTGDTEFSWKVEKGE